MHQLQNIHSDGECGASQKNENYLIAYLGTGIFIALVATGKEREIISIINKEILKTSYNTDLNLNSLNYNLTSDYR